MLDEVGDVIGEQQKVGTTPKAIKRGQRPTCTERRIAHQECGWEGGDSTNSAEKNLAYE